ncbi:hypothetical protein K8I85_02325 [bacterium]|nr:hypothetical protein [bacterium]
MSTMSKSRKCLFGGTILAAGLMTQAASAQASFNLGSYFTGGTYAGGYASFGPYIGSGPFAFLGGDSYTLAATSATSTQVYALAFNSGASHGHWAQAFSSYVNFTVTQNGTATASWDFSADSVADPGFYASGIWVRNLDLGTDVFVNPWDGGNNGNPVAGTVQIPLQAGVNYQVEVYAAAYGVDGASSVSLSIPAPGSAALVGLAGLVAAPRRRR